MENENLRTCRLCGEAKLVEFFEIDNRVKNGRTNRCKACKSGLEDRARRAFRHIHEKANAVGTEVEVTLTEIKALFETFDGNCVYCNAKEQPQGPRFHIDHVIARKEGGRDHISNLVIACPSCNSRKSNKPVVTHYFEDERFISKNFSVLVHYLALHVGQPASETLDSFVEQHAEYEIRKLWEEMDKAGGNTDAI